MSVDTGALRIGEFARRVGVSPELLRAWERRYGLLQPIRSEGGFRLYTSEDAERVARMRHALDEGLSAAEAARRALAQARPTQAALDDARERLLAAARDYDEAAVHSVLDQALAGFALETVLRELIMPVLRAIGEEWERGKLEVGQEHFISNLVRERLLALARLWSRGGGPLAILACAPGERHDIGLVAFGLVLRSHGWRILFLGADTPLATLRGAVRSAPARSVGAARSLGRGRVRGALLPPTRRPARRRPGHGNRNPPHCMSSGGRILLTGATGYVGGRLLTALLERGEDVRCFARRPEAIPSRTGLDVAAGDVLDADAVRRALEGMEVAYYLVHAMGSPDSFEQLDRRAAEIFAEAARDAGVRRIVYLGGLGSGPELSPHLASRQEVGRLLASSGVETIEFRASIVIGSGSLSFELVRSLTERLPVMITPRWVRTRAQPIAIEDVIAYLVAALDLDSRGSEMFEIGGAEVATYGELMREYARQRGLRRLLVPVPVLTPRLSSLWLGLVTPVYARVGRKLVESLPHETVVHDPSALERFPIRPRGYREAIARALSNEENATVETRWSDALSVGRRSSWRPGPSLGGRLIDARVREVPVPPGQAFVPIRRIGGTAGWYYGNALWRLRGLLDLLVGGVGLRRGRRDPETPAVGSALDFWRVEAYEPDRLLRLRAEMRLPGRAWLQFEVDGDARGSRIRQTATFDPSGRAGLLYWYALLPIHGLVFRGMLAGIAREATGAETRSFEHRHVVRRGIAETFAFFSEPANLPRLTPRLLCFRIVERPARIELGSRFRYRVGPVDWVAEVAAWDPPAGFADVQVSGPYRVWRHRHELAEIPAGTEVRDRVDYRLRGGLAARALEPLHRAFLRTLFSYRSRRLDEQLG